MKQPVRVAVTGAAGNISRILIFKLITGEMLGKEQPVILNLIELPQAIDALRGVAMEIEDGAYPLVHGVTLHDNPESGFAGAHYAILVGAKPRSKGMERGDLLKANAQIFSAQGKAINDYANPDIKVLVVGNPANTNALIASRNAPNLNPSQFTAMTRLDQNRMSGLLASQLSCNASDVVNPIIWGNHSPTMYPDLHHATALGLSAMEQIDLNWYKDNYIPRVQQRGAEIIQVSGHSSVASAAQAALDHMRDLVCGTPEGRYVSMAVMSDGSYGIAPGIMFSFPVRCCYGRYQIVQNLSLTKFCQERLKKTEEELLKEREAVSDLLPKETEKSYERLAKLTIDATVHFMATPKIISTP